MIRTTELRTAEVLSDSFSAPWIIADQPDGCVAAHAQQPSHLPGGVVVVDTQHFPVGAASRGVASGTSATLGRQEDVVLFDPDAVLLRQVLAPDVFGVGFTPCSVLVPDQPFWLAGSVGGGSGFLPDGAPPAIAPVADQGHTLRTPEAESLTGVFVDVNDAMALTGGVVVTPQELDRFAFTVTEAGVAHLGDVGLPTASAMTVPYGDQAPWGALACVVRIIHEKEDTES